ncbi:MAG: hypothetical protein HPY44_20915 [Armatimonadetes bacterium]|nr:hypothetical protein [Armatimonadota bacterium]
MWNPFAPRHTVTDVSLDHVPVMQQTEDAFTTLAHAVAALLRLYGRPRSVDEAALHTGDCFAIDLSTESPGLGLTASCELLTEGLQDLGLLARLACHSADPDQYTRLFTVVRAGLRNYRPTLACGGWPNPSTTGRRGYFWGIVHGFDLNTADFVGSTVRDPFLDKLLATDLVWPVQPETIRGAYLIEGWQEPPLKPGKLIRRALARGVSLLAGEGGIGGLAAYARLLRVLAKEELAPDSPLASRYPFPMMVAVRTQFEQIARNLDNASAVVPRRLRATMSTCRSLAHDAANLLLNSEPPRVYGRRARGAIRAGKWPWAEDAWQKRVEELADPSSDAREAEIERIETLRDLHGRLTEALDLLVS